MTEEEIKQETPLEEDYKDKYLRLLAEQENARKRLFKDKQESTRYAIESMLAEVLTPVDSLESALSFTEHMNEETRTWAQGFQMILAQFKQVLTDHGVVAFHSQGSHFDPHRHEAVEIEETDEHPDGTILQEFVKGYKCGDRVIRPARVKVAKQPIKGETV